MQCNVYLLQATPTHCRPHPPTAGPTHPLQATPTNTALHPHTAGHIYLLQATPTHCRLHLPTQVTPTSSIPHPLTTSVILRRAIESKRSVGDRLEPSSARTHRSKPQDARQSPVGRVYRTAAPQTHACLAAPPLLAEEADNWVNTHHPSEQCTVWHPPPLSQCAS